MSKIYFTAIIVTILFLGCNQLNTPDDVVVNSASLKQMINSAVAGDTLTNDRLSGLINLNLPINKKYNKLFIDSSRSPLGNFYYYLVLEYPNPIYNCFAVYDTQLNALLIDRSLNGYIDVSSIAIQERTFIQVNETFLSKDIFELNRLSLYTFDSASVDLVYRSYSRLKTPDNVFKQKIVELNKERIKTEILSEKLSSITNKGDVFLFDDDFKKYISSSDIFSGFVRNEVKMLSYPYANKIFNSYESAMLSTETDDTSLKNIDADVKNFKLTVTQDWIEDSSWTITKNLKLSLFGTTYRNKTANAVINIAPLASRDSSEIYSCLPLKNLQSGNYDVRYSDKKDNGSTYLQYFEYSSCGKKFLIIFEASKQGYDRNKTMYEKIINSFTIDC